MSNEFPVVLGIDLDCEAIWEGKDAANLGRPVLLSHGAFAINEGLNPLLDLLDRHSIRASFFVPGVTCDRYPEAIGEVFHRGHEVCSHSYHHRPISVNMSFQEEKSELKRGIDSITNITKEIPTTWRSPSWEWSGNTLGLLLEHGVAVSVSFHDKVRPYRHQQSGDPVPLVELPVQWHLADAPFFLHGGQVGRTIRSASDAQEVWEEEFVGLYEVPGAFYNLTLHVQLIGHPGRLRMLDRHIEFIKAHSRARFMTCNEVAATVP